MQPRTQTTQDHTATELPIGERMDVCSRARYLDSTALRAAVARAERAVLGTYTVAELRAARYALTALHSEQRRRQLLKSA